MVNYVCTQFLKDKYLLIKEDNNNWREATTGPFAGKYWKTMKTDISNLESMGAWEIVYRDENINIIQQTWAFKCKL